MEIAAKIVVSLLLMECVAVIICGAFAVLVKEAEFMSTLIGLNMIGALIGALAVMLYALTLIWG